MATFVATANTASTTATATLARFHSSTKDDSVLHSTGRKRSSSFTVKGRMSMGGNNVMKSTINTTATSAATSYISKTADTLLRERNQYESPIAHHDLSAPLSLLSSSSSDSGATIIESTTATTTTALNKAHPSLGDGSDRINLVPSSSSSTDYGHNHNYSTSNSNNSSHRQTWSPQSIQNNDLQNDRTQENAPMVCTGRSRSNTLTNSGTGSAEIAAAAVSSQFNHVMRPRRTSLVNRPSGTIVQVMPGIPSIVLPTGETIQLKNNTASHSHYPPTPLLPQYQDDVAEAKNSIEECNSDTNGTNDNKAPSSTPWGNLGLGFLSRIVILIGLFGLSLGGLYLLAKVLPPLSLPKSVDDVKVDAKILQEFATATYEGWIRTFWVFSVVYMWKQCFGIPGSAFLNILAGALYGPWFGTFLTSLLTTLGSVLAYFMSFFLMEPILNRYASTRLDQMRLQIQKKTARAEAKAGKSTSTATSTGVQTSINTPSSASTVTGSNGSSASTSAQRGSLRPRSSSFTIRRTDETNQDTSPTHHISEIEIQESESLLSDERNTEKILPHPNDSQQETGDKDEDVDESDSEGTSLFMQLLLIRLFPLTPYWFINLASPLVGVPVIPFMTTMFLGCMPYNYICAQAGAILGEIHELSDIYQQPWIVFQILLVLVLSALAVWASKRSKKQQLEKEERKSRTSEEELGEDESTHRLLRETFESEQRHSRDKEEEEGDQDEQDEDIAMSSLSHQSGANKRDSAIIDMSAFRY
ncbi:Transmembrane protein 41A [Mortierella polycephala]|uniref:Transmembrane protein 41A n=1 Tax=Mortierella polycephala TaxID=41804 RepID=A0A9P6PQ62_9FUNG|nr:Transmembrane protein 41A [Mortierella polycephala]